MAKLKPSRLIHMTSGKVNGQVISRYANGVVVKNIVQPSHIGNHDQRIKRFETNTISQRWSQLTPTEKASYAYESANYFKLDKMGFLQPRTGYGLFLFLNQNKKLLNETAPLIAPPFELMVDPQAYITNKSATELSIKSDNTRPGYIYALFADVNISSGSQPSVKNEKLCTMIDPSSLAIGLDVSDLVQQSFDFPVNLLRTGVRLSAIDSITGNREPLIDWLNLKHETVFISGIYLTSTFSGHAFSQNGLLMFMKKHNGPTRRGVLADSWNLNTFVELPDINVWQQQTFNFMFSNDGLKVFVATSLNSVNEIICYRMTVPYNLATSSIDGRITLQGTALSKALYLNKSGTILISSKPDYTEKFTLSTPFDINTAILTDSNQTNTLTSFQTMFYSTDGYFYYRITSGIITQYSLLTPFQIENVTDTPISSVDLNSMGNMTIGNNVSLFMPYSGEFFSVGYFTTTPGHNIFATFKFATLFNL